MIPKVVFPQYAFNYKHLYVETVTIPHLLLGHSSITSRQYVSESSINNSEVIRSATRSDPFDTTRSVFIREESSSNMRLLFRPCGIFVFRYFCSVTKSVATHDTHYLLPHFSSLPCTLSSTLSSKEVHREVGCTNINNSRMIPVTETSPLYFGFGTKVS